MREFLTQVVKKNFTFFIIFVLGGAGYGNGPSYLTFALDRDMEISAYDYGAGLKYLVGIAAAVRDFIIISFPYMLN